MESVYLSAMPELLAKGYVPVPLIASTKRPFEKGWATTYGEGPFSSPEALIERLKVYLPSAMPELAILTYSNQGRESVPWHVGVAARDGVSFVDVDDPAEIAAVEAITGLNQSNTTVKFGRKGATYFFRLPALPDGITSRCYNQRIRGKIDLLTWHAQTVVPPSIHSGTGLPYRWGPLGLLPAAHLPEVSLERLDALLAHYDRKPKPSQTATPTSTTSRRGTEGLNDLGSDVTLSPKLATALTLRIDTILEAMRVRGSATLVGRNRSGAEWALSIATNDWISIAAAVVDFAGGDWRAAERFLDRLSNGIGLPASVRAKVVKVYDRARNRSKIAGLRDADTFSQQTERKPRSRLTLDGLYRGARHILGHSPDARLDSAHAASKAIASGTVDLEELIGLTRLAITSRSRSGPMRDLALLLLEAAATGRGVLHIDRQRREQLCGRLRISSSELARMLCRLDGRGLFVIKGGKGGMHVTTIGLNAELAHRHDPEWRPAQHSRRDREACSRENVTAVLPQLIAVDEKQLPLALAEHELLPDEVVDVLHEPDWPVRTRRHVVEQEQRLALELGYLRRRACDADNVKLTSAARSLHNLDNHPQPDALIHVVLLEAYSAYLERREAQRERMRKEGQSEEIPPSSKLGVYRDALAEIMAGVDMGTKRYRTITFWERVKRGEAPMPLKRKFKDNDSRCPISH